MHRVPQPPVNPALRDREMRGVWSGLIALLLGGLLVVGGARHLTGIETVDGPMASELQLVKAYSSGGLQFPESVAPAPPGSDDPSEMDRWARRNADKETPTWKVRVDTAAKTPCPT